MSRSRKSRLKKAALKKAAFRWLCAAAIVSNPTVTAVVSQVVPPMTAAAAQAEEYDGVINLGDLSADLGPNISRGTSCYYDVFTISESGTYKLTGSNYMNDSYYGVSIRVKTGCNVTLVCDDVYIRNEEQPNVCNAYRNVTLFDVESGAHLTLTGRLMADTFTQERDGTYSTQSFWSSWDRVNSDDLSRVMFLGADGSTVNEVYVLNASEENSYTIETDTMRIYKPYFSGHAEKRTPFTDSFSCLIDGAGHVENGKIVVTGDAIVSCYNRHIMTDEGECNRSRYTVIDINKVIIGTASAVDGVEFYRDVDNNAIIFTASGTYVLDGSNCSGDSYSDIQIRVEDGCDVALICNDVYVNNDSLFVECEYGEYKTPPVPILLNGDATLTLTGRMVVDPVSADLELEYDLMDFVGGTGTLKADFSCLSLTDRSGEAVKKIYCLDSSDSNPYVIDSGKLTTVSEESDGVIVKPFTDSFYPIGGNVKDGKITVTGDADVKCFDASHIIDLGKLINGEQREPDEVEFLERSGYIDIKFNDSDAYLIKGSNQVDYDEFYDIRFYAGRNVVLNLVFDDVYIRNDSFTMTSGRVNPIITFVNYYEDSVMNLSGRLVVDTFTTGGNSESFASAPVLSGIGTINANFSTVDFANRFAEHRNAVYCLDASETNSYDIFPYDFVYYNERYGCYNTDEYSCFFVGPGFEHVDNWAPVTVTGDTTVYGYGEHEYDERGECLNYKNSRTIDLSQVDETDRLLGVNIRAYDEMTQITIDKSGTYYLKGSNYIGDTYVDVTIEVMEDVEAEIICEDAYIQNDDASVSDTAISTNSPFVVNDNAKLTLKGKLAVDTCSCKRVTGGFRIQDIAECKGSGSVNTKAFSVLEVRDPAGETMKKVFCLEASEENSYEIKYNTFGYFSEAEGNKKNFDEYCIRLDGKHKDSFVVTGDRNILCEEHEMFGDKCIHGLEEYTIDLGRLKDYITGTETAPAGLNIRYGEADGKMFSSIVEIEITTGGTYRLTGSNTINDAFVDVKIIAKNCEAYVYCEGASITNRYAEFVGCVWPYAYSVTELDYDLAVQNYVVPFKADRGKLTFKGELSVDPFAMDLGRYTFAAPVFEGTPDSVNLDCFSTVAFKKNGEATINEVYYLDTDKQVYVSDLNSAEIRTGKNENKKIRDMFPCIAEQDSERVTSSVVIDCYDSHSVSDDLICEHCGLQEYDFRYNSITLSDNIGLNVFMKFDDILENDKITMNFEIGSKVVSTAAMKDAEKVTIDGEEVYRFTCPVAAAEMADSVKAVLRYDGKDISSKTYSVVSYAEYILENAEKEEFAGYVSLVKAMLNYGAEAQKYFKHNEQSLANASLSAADKAAAALTADQVKGAQYTVTGADMDYTFKGINLSLDGNVVLKLVFENNGKQTVEEIPLNAGELGIGKTYSYYGYTFGNLSAYSYIQQAISDKSLTEIVTALYYYSEAAKGL